MAAKGETSGSCAVLFLIIVIFFAAGGLAGMIVETHSDLRELEERIEAICEAVGCEDQA